MIRRAIYGLFDDKGVCFYVGQTRNPKARAMQHKCAWRGRNLSFHILRWCREPDALRIEFQVIQAYQRRNQCIMPGYRFNVMPEHQTPSQKWHKQLARLISHCEHQNALIHDALKLERVNMQINCDFSYRYR